ncbi:MAG: ribosome biogenesis GTPase Der [Candidatus Neomarinimicrobiota bacterium]|nr:MAG: ribosome biogenesis GTPase Der [Candidatus Neomarinimicrobiota bacterium]
MTKHPVIAIVGRPNVGKSTLFNRFIRVRKAVVDATEGITRDRIYGEMDWRGISMTIVDTGGYIPEDTDIFNAAVRKQARLAVEEADLILFLVDGRSEPTASDMALARLIHETGKPVVLGVNKCDHTRWDDQAYLYYELGLEPVLPISALSGRLTGDLLDLIVEKLHLSPSGSGHTGEEEPLKITIAGMPNVGKSSLMNALLQKEQSIVTPVAGTTRDSIDTTFRWYGRDIILIDTAGLRKRMRIKDQIEYFSTVRTHKAIQRSDVVLVVIDAVKGFGNQDKSIVDLVIKEGKGLVLLVNKWDLVEKDSNTMVEFGRTIVDAFPALKGYPQLFISAKTRQRVSRVLDLAWNVGELRKKTIPTRDLNTWLQGILQQNPPPAVHGRQLKMKFVSQVHRAPPIFAFFMNYPKLVPVQYRRYLENRLREAFDLEGVPIRLTFRKK